MSHQQRIIELRNEIPRLKDELAQEQNAYMADALANNIRSEDFGEWKFRIQPKPAYLKLEEDAVPGTFYKLAIDKRAVREYLKANGAQPWGALSESGFKLVVTNIAGHTEDDGHPQDTGHLKTFVGDITQ
jgi:hypothetical protein